MKLNSFYVKCRGGAEKAITYKNLRAFLENSVVLSKPSKFRLAEARRVMGDTLFADIIAYIRNEYKEELLASLDNSSLSVTENQRGGCGARSAHTCEEAPPKPSKEEGK